MARRPRSVVQTMEPRGSIIDPRVRFVPVHGARKLMTVHSDEVFPEQTDGAIVWIEPQPGQTAEQLEHARSMFARFAYAVRLLPAPTEDAVLPVDAGTASPLSDVSEVRPVVTELVEELPPDLRVEVGDYCENLLSNAGL